MSKPTPHANPATVFLLNIVPGALLALFGTALLTTEARGMFLLSHRPAIQRQAPAAEGTSWHRRSPDSMDDPAAWRPVTGTRS